MNPEGISYSTSHCVTAKRSLNITLEYGRSHGYIVLRSYLEAKLTYLVRREAWRVDLLIRYLIKSRPRNDIGAVRRSVA